VASAPDSVLLLAFGGPTSPEEIRPFLDNVLRGRPLPKERYEEIVSHYEKFGGVSPLTRLTIRQAEGLRDTLARDGHPLPVYIGMRHWKPYIREALSTMAGQGHEWGIGLIRGAHPSHASGEAYYDAVQTAQDEVGPAAPRIDYTGPWFDHPLFIEALVGRVRDALSAVPDDRRGSASLVFTGHSLPVAMSDASGYAASLECTAGLVAGALGIDNWTLVYQNRSGSPRQPWLEPDIVDELAAQKERGARDVIVAPIGFVCDHVEVLYDLDTEARLAADKLGLGFHRAATVGDHPAFLHMLGEVVRETIKRVAA
jgi:ferrochelatase